MGAMLMNADIPLIILVTLRFLLPPEFKIVQQ